MKRYLVLLLLSVIVSSFAEEKIEEKEVKIPLSIKTEFSPWDATKIIIVIQGKDLIFVPENKDLTTRSAKLVVADEKGVVYELKDEVFYSWFKPRKAKKGEETGIKTQLEWKMTMIKRFDDLRGKQLHIKGNVYYEMPEMIRIYPAQPLVLKKGERLVWENFDMEICSEPVIASSMEWDWREKTYIAKQVEGEPLHFFVLANIETLDNVEILDELFYDSSLKHNRLEGRGYAKYLVNGKRIQSFYYQFSPEDKCEELLMSLNYTKKRIRYRIPVDLKVTVPEKDEKTLSKKAGD